MKVVFQPSQSLQFELEGSTQKELFKQLSEINEIFADEPCGACGDTNTYFNVRTVDENDYFERRCPKCHATLPYGQAKKGGKLFPKRKDDNGDWSKTKGWSKYEGKKK